MPYVRRGPDGRIESLHLNGSDGMEFLPDTHPEVYAFFGHSAPGTEDFVRLDAGFVRVIEDVIDALIVKNILNITDLPSEAQAKLFARKSFRERVSQHSLRLFSDNAQSPLIDDTHFGGLR